MTINKSQGQTLSKVGVYLKKNQFLHMVSSMLPYQELHQKKGLFILIEDESGNCNSMTRNIVYKEVFERIAEQDPHE
jgi:hypothetical protein